MVLAKTVAVVPAAGRGARMGSHLPKQFLSLGGLPILVHSLRVLHAVPAVEHIILVVPEADRQYCLTEIVTRHRFAKVTKIVAGGEQRQDSVRHGIQEAGDDAELLLIHDAVRPLITRELVERVIQRAAEVGAAIVAIPMRDTVKRVNHDGVIETTVDRRPLWLAQTPQVFRADVIREAHRKAHIEKFHATDDAQLLEWIGRPVAVVDGSEDNIKITRPQDMAIGEAILAARSRT
jgi:2-C-methyl-D-erythritol 4-phosphate cytidylyltransferase